METEVTKKLVAGGRGREGKEDIPKRKTPFFFTLKSLSNKQQLFLLHRQRSLQTLACNLSMQEHLVACRQTCGLAHLPLEDTQINGKIQLIYGQQSQLPLI